MGWYIHKLWREYWWDQMYSDGPVIVNAFANLFKNNYVDRQDICRSQVIVLSLVLIHFVWVLQVWQINWIALMWAVGLDRMIFTSNLLNAAHLHWPDLFGYYYKPLISIFKNSCRKGGINNYKPNAKVSLIPEIFEYILQDFMSALFGYN